VKLTRLTRVTVTLPNFLAVLGGITGPLGFVISLLVFYRDRPRIVVDVSWNMVAMPPRPDYPESFASVTVSNIGRRSIYVSHITGEEDGNRVHMLIPASVPGKILSEGSAPWSVIVDEAQFKSQQPPWWNLRFYVCDTAGRRYYSRWPEKAPDWASGQSAPADALERNRQKNGQKRLIDLIRP
jgi:hypothetical protein